MTTKGIKITVGEFKSQLESFNENDVLDFSGLDFYRLKKRGPELVQVEFNQTVYVNSEDKVQIENHE
ncbi:hypothetical protein [Teredinibacter turnerae]|uniref:hypothetical protein n=1 Tax=Teredinibacter turnerae TaxID=2426 RepID=UPI0003FB6986|nr:hypothetical protein [Teredinibacter turnerae]